MPLFHRLETEQDLATAQQHGLPTGNETDVRLYTSLDKAQAQAPGPILVVDESILDHPNPPPNDAFRVPSVPPTALQNLPPYRPPRAVTAAGGYVACPLPSEIALLLIHRRGVWDLPKGHLDPNETLSSCALREVREEVGVDELHLLCALGTTQHGYPRDDHYAVKTTHWFLMRTPERSFEPDHRENIRRVAWARWPVARRHVGYDTLRRHMDRIESTVRATLS